MSVWFDPPGHVCSRCKPGFPREMDGTTPWKHEGKWMVDECPTEVLPRWVFEAAAEFQDYELGHTPVTTGRAPWLTGFYQAAMRTFRTAVNEKKAEQAEAKVKG